MEKARLNLLLDADLHKRLKLQAIDSNTTMSQLTIEAIKDLLNKKEKEKEKK